MAMSPKNALGSMWGPVCMGRGWILRLSVLVPKLHQGSTEKRTTTGPHMGSIRWKFWQKSKEKGSMYLMYAQQRQSHLLH